MPFRQSHSRNETRALGPIRVLKEFRHQDIIGGMSQKIDEATVRHIAHLARLELTDAEVAQFSTDLGDILAHVETLNAVDTDGVEATAHALPLANVFRADEPRPSLDHADALRNAPDQEDGYFKVPKVLDQGQA